MNTLHFSILINAPRSKVWESVIQDASYRQWTEVFAPGSHFIGGWSKGSKIQFLGPNDKGIMEGMSSIVVDNIPDQFISLKHVGFIKDGVEDTESDEVKKWTPAYENYTFKELNEITEFSVDIDITPEYEAYFQDTWPLALNRLKQVAEGQSQSQMTVQTTVKAPLDLVWLAWVTPKDITQWYTASPDWGVPYAENDLRENGVFKTRMEANDKSVGFDFEGTYTCIRHQELIEYKLADNRRVTIQFVQFPDGIKVIETFELETQNAADLQRAGWQAILENFKQYVENKVTGV